MEADGYNSKAVNNGTINLDGVDYTVYNFDGSVADGVVIYVIGMKADERSSSLTNSKNGTININSKDGVGMHADDYGKVINQGTININGKDGIGMYATKGGNAINDETGIINLNNSDGIGMYATGIGSTVENRGTIYLSGTLVEAGVEVDKSSSFLGNGLYTGKDSQGNFGMKVKDGAQIINKGKIKFGN